jgi:hypothetical protein
MEVADTYRTLALVHRGRDEALQKRGTLRGTNAVGLDTTEHLNDVLTGHFIAVRHDGVSVNLFDGDGLLKTLFKVCSVRVVSNAA